MLLRRLWLLFAQAVAIGVAMIFVVETLRPHWLNHEFSPPITIDVRPPAGVAANEAAIPASAAPSASRSGAPSAVFATAPGTAVRTTYAEAARRSMPAVVNIYTAKEVNHAGPADPLLRQLFRDRAEENGHGGGEVQRVSSLGSGVIVASSGYIVTNNHVVEGADEIAIALSDGRKLHARMIGADPETDLAVLKVDLTDLPAITFARSTELRVGDVVLAIGNPFDVGQTVTMGIVSALGRTNLDLNSYDDFIQTDAAINQGNSGGALVDADGMLVGINTAIYSSRGGGSLGIGFAIPSDTIAQVMEQLISRGHVRRGYFGVEPYDITPEIATSRNLERVNGVVVNTVIRDAPAGKAGIRPDDVLLAINGDPVTASRPMLSQIAKLEPGSTAKVTVMRQGKKMEFKVAVGERPTAEQK
jgi:serine protease DegQ